jgi:hypothetical protein
MTVKCAICQDRNAKTDFYVKEYTDDSFREIGDVPACEECRDRLQENWG